MRRIVVLLVVYLCSSASFGGVVEATKDGVDVLATAEKGSTVLQKLNKGEVVSASERSGMYWQVKTKDGRTGFVSVLAVKAKPGDNKDLNEAMREAVMSGRAQQAADGGRTRSAVMGVRGLDDTSDTSLAASLRPNLHAVYAMEDRDLPRGRVDQQTALVAAEIQRKSAARN